ncbi:MAG TPA: MFS transporter [Candidatus Hydrogenedentes bacterium]|nr:MFS transporter [Candidatus Hydrogenedentota bacterium]
MSQPPLHPQAKVAFVLAGLYNAAEALCQVFVSVYFWRNSNDLMVLCWYYLALYSVTPIMFIVCGWYSKVRDRLHVYRLGIIFHAVYYGTLLVLREESVNYTLPLGVLLGITWGAFWAGANTINYDVTTSGRREHFIGIMNAISHFARLCAPLISGFIITRMPDRLQGYHLIFGIVIVLYVLSFFASFLMTPDPHRTPFRMKRALFPGKEDRDWRCIMLASFTLAGTFEIPTNFLGILMFMETQNELSVGSYAAYQAIVAIVVSYVFGRWCKPETRRQHLFWSSMLLAASGLVFFFPLTLTSLLIFAMLRSAAMAMFGIGHFSTRMEVIMNTAQDPLQRIEYLCAWEVPLAIGRTIMMLLMIALALMLDDASLGIRIVIIVLCALRLATYYFLAQTSVLAKPARAE